MQHFQKEILHRVLNPLLLSTDNFPQLTFPLSLAIAQHIVSSVKPIKQTDQIKGKITSLTPNYVKS